MTKDDPKILFIINPGSGNKKIDWKGVIDEYFKDKPINIEQFQLPNPCKPEQINDAISQSTATKVIAVGGDGTVKMVANCIKSSDRILGIIPAGSANGLAGELGILNDPQLALDTVVNGEVKKIHLTKVNDELCIHLSDIGFNAFVVKKFQAEGKRGMWGYVKAAFKVLRQHYRMQISIGVDEGFIKREAVMLVIANATRYGTGVVINPNGTLYDHLFEVVIVKKISFSEIFKMRFNHKSFDPDKTEVLQTSSLHINTRHKVHFQVDGEYLGKVNRVDAKILPHSLNVIISRSASA